MRLQNNEKQEYGCPERTPRFSNVSRNMNTTVELQSFQPFLLALCLIRASSERRASIFASL